MIGWNRKADPFLLSILWLASCREGKAVVGECVRLVITDLFHNRY